MFTFSSAFYALLLANVLFTTTVWGWSILHAGLLISPAPLMAALTAPIGGVLSDRLGQRVVAIPGGLLFAAGCLWFATLHGPEPDYVSEMLPGQLLTGSGVGLSFAAWGSAAVAELPPARFATGSAILGCVRQVAAVLGIAILVARAGGGGAGAGARRVHRRVDADGDRGSGDRGDRGRARRVRALAGVEAVAAEPA